MGINIVDGENVLGSVDAYQLCLSQATHLYYFANITCMDIKKKKIGPDLNGPKHISLELLWLFVFNQLCFVFFGQYIFTN